VGYCQSSPNVPAHNATTAAKPIAAPSTVANPPAVSAPPPVDNALSMRAERDAYKQIIEAHQRTLTTLQWAIDIIGSLLLALVAYAVFKSNKDYKEARDDAKEASKEARQWEKEARDIRDKLDMLANAKITEIDKLADTELGKIRTQAKEALDEIEKRGEEKIAELLAKAETERKVTELWNDGLRATKTKEYELIQAKYAQLIKQNPNCSEAYSNWCGVVSGWAVQDKDERLIKDAVAVYENFKALVSAHKGNPKMNIELVAAASWLADAYIKLGKKTEAQAFLTEIEPVAKTLPESDERQVLLNWIIKLHLDIVQK
jgi:hypothetical protein